MAPGATEDPALPAVTIKALLALHAKRTRDMFAGDANKPVPLDEARWVSTTGSSHPPPPPSIPPQSIPLVLLSLSACATLSDRVGAALCAASERRLPARSATPTPVHPVGLCCAHSACWAVQLLYRALLRCSCCAASRISRLGRSHAAGAVSTLWSGFCGDEWHRKWHERRSARGGVSGSSGWQQNGVAQHDCEAHRQHAGARRQARGCMQRFILQSPLDQLPNCHVMHHVQRGHASWVTHIRASGDAVSRSVSLEYRPCQSCLIDLRSGKLCTYT